MAVSHASIPVARRECSPTLYGNLNRVIVSKIVVFNSSWPAKTNNKDSGLLQPSIIKSPAPNNVVLRYILPSRSNRHSAG